MAHFNKMIISALPERQRRLLLQWHQNLLGLHLRVAVRHISKSPVKAAANAKTTRTTNKHDSVKNVAPKKPVPPPPSRAKPEEPDSVEQKGAPQAPPRKKQSKELLKTDSKKSIGSVNTEQPTKLEKQTTIEDKGNLDATKPKAPSRQSSIGKMAVKPASEKKQDVQLQSLKSIDSGCIL
ncbi:hypothetical protein ANCCAN_04694 [Ancylostoma caninum]|uniref:Uncharacterized protein n=1 Tax=Ancylostoma caninum TaxID=29170 RepID=A0A368H0Y8_ANCCA|nr:hypothetical protein ANCCAN_04694 [Ancylostoma caninum]